MNVDEIKKIGEDESISLVNEITKMLEDSAEKALRYTKMGAGKPPMETYKLNVLGKEVEFKGAQELINFKNDIKRVYGIK